MIHKQILDQLKVITAEEQRLLNGQDSIDRTLYMESEKSVINGKKLLSEGELITIRPHTRFVHFPPHLHDYIEVIYMCSGQTTHIIDGDKVILKEGELLFLCQSAVQEILPAEQNDVAVNFVILPEFFDSSLNMMDNYDAPLCRFLIDCLKNKISGTSYLHFRVADVLPAQNLIENLLWTLIGNAQENKNINQYTMGLLIMQLTCYTDRLSSQPEDDKLIVSVLRYIEENYRHGTLTEIASILRCDVSVLSRRIKDAMGRNYTELVQEKRLSQACYLLKNTKLAIEDVAVMVGYENVSFFHNLFKKNYGISPGRFRRGTGDE